MGLLKDWWECKKLTNDIYQLEEKVKDLKNDIANYKKYRQEAINEFNKMDNFIKERDINKA